MEIENKNIRENEHLESLISLEQITLLYGSLKFSLGASFIVALIMYYTLLGHSNSDYHLKIWLISVFVVFTARALDATQFNLSSNEIKNRPIWHYRFLCGALSGGLLWGSLAWLGHSSRDEYQMLIIMCTVGVCAGSLSSLAFSWRALITFFTPATVLLTANMFVSEGEFLQTTAIILTFFILFTLMSGKRIFNNTYQNIRLRIEADSREVALELLHQKQSLHSQQTPLAVIEFDLKLHITEWNKAAEQIFGYKRNEAIGNNILKLIVPEQSLKHVETIWDNVLNLKTVNGEAVENNKKNGDNIHCQWYITPLTKRNNNIVGIAAMALDITDKKQFEDKLVNARNESDRANRAKSDFLSNMSHELRTPLNAILGFTQLLNVDTLLDKQQQNYISEIERAGQLQLELVNQILDLARIEHGHTNLSIEKVSIFDIIDECYMLISPLANNKQITIKSLCNNKQYYLDTEFVNADYTRLKQVIINLLTNAIKYNTDNGNVIISCEKNKTGDNTRINITDTGKGIHEDLHKDIFTPFNRLEIGNTIEGTGIGLSISKQLIEKMGGSIGVYSNPKAGSTFWVELESCIPGDSISTTTYDSGTDTKISKSPESTTNSNINILIAEDNPINQTLILSQLNTLGHKADLVENGKEALAQLKIKHYDILFTDCNMPIMDGYELARTIRGNGNNNLKIIALTADAFPEKEVLCLEAGMDARITKPVSLEVLNDTIKTHYLKN